MKKPILLSGIIGLLLISIIAGFKSPVPMSDFWLDYITSHLKRYIQKYHQNKVYLNTDRDEYNTGETIFYKAYVLNDVEKKPENLIKNLYIEMVAPDNGIFMRRLLKIENGFAHGDFPVLDTVYSGLYQLRAYTLNMRNSGNEYLFTKEIRINHREKLYYNKVFHRKAKKIARQKENFDLQFFPEGGEMIDNIKTKVAFKALNQNGQSMNVKGKIYTGKEIYVCDFESVHQGMGQFEITPAFKQQYYALIETENKKHLKVNLPEVVQNGYTLNIEDAGNIFKVNIQTNKVFGADPVAKTVYLIIQSGGKIYSSGAHIFEKNQIQLNIGKKIFPSGILQFTLFDGQGKPQCERLAFVDNDDYLNIKTNLIEKERRKREKIEIEISAKNSDNEPVAGDFYLAVRQKNKLGTNEKQKTDIRSYLLLQSDLKGNIENPGFYFSHAPQANKMLDLLLLTQGWRKFMWKDILIDSIPEPAFPVETDLRITGRVTKYLFDISVKKAKLTMTLLNQFNDVFKTESADKGYFEFTNLDYSDTMDVLIEVRTPHNKKNVMILVDEQDDIVNAFYPFKDFYVDSLKRKHKTEYKQHVKEEPDPNVPTEMKLHHAADQVVKFDDQMRASSSNVLDILESRVPGLQVGSGSSMMRGPSSFMMSNEPLYLIDGIPTDYNGIQSINIQDVDYVEILKGPSAAIYGMRGANGVIAVYTKKGFYYKRGEIRFKMLGYHTPKKFYSPKYLSKQENTEISDNRKTIFWAPSVKTDKDGKAHIEFYHSDLAGEFEILIEGMDLNGKVGSCSFTYHVDN